MKRILLFLGLLLGIVMFVNAQTNPIKLHTLSTGDTVLNTATVNHSLKLPLYYPVGSFQVVNTKVSGTVAGNSIFEGSDDNGTTWIQLDTLVNTNQATNTKIFDATPAKYLHYRVRTTGTGTMVMKSKTWAVLRR